MKTCSALYPNQFDMLHDHILRKTKIILLTCHAHTLPLAQPNHPWAYLLVNVCLTFHFQFDMLNDRVLNKPSLIA